MSQSKSHESLELGGCFQVDLLKLNSIFIGSSNCIRSCLPNTIPQKKCSSYFCDSLVSMPFSISLVRCIRRQPIRNLLCPLLIDWYSKRMWCIERWPFLLEAGETVRNKDKSALACRSTITMIYIDCQVKRWWCLYRMYDEQEHKL